MGAIHGDKKQEERIWALEEFRDRDVSCLVSTNCLGRGHDIPRVRFVINYDAPENVESYIHRVGRTGRAGETGFAMTFLTSNDYQLAEALKQVLKETDQKASPKLEELASGAGNDLPWWQQEDKTGEGYSAGADTPADQGGWSYGQQTQ